MSDTLPPPITPTYPDAPDSLLDAWDYRRGPMRGARHGALPPADADLDRLRDTPVSLPFDPGEAVTGGALRRKLDELGAEFAGMSQLAFYNALCIAHLRKRDWPEHAPDLFRRLWREQGSALMAELPGRWLISSAITFAAHGATEADRLVGQSLNVLFSLMKLYEYERALGGADPGTALPRQNTRDVALPLGMTPFSLRRGKLDVEFLAPIWSMAEAADEIRPLALHLLTLLNNDPRTLFRRIVTLRAAMGVPPIPEKL